ncbi:MAG TPA: calcium/sodium antiporter [Nitrososphaeraceae archaeon]|nr:calcium/sodium antiporter [Nitrososphaeraceae archaeon]
MLTIIINVLLVAVGLAMLFAGSEFLIRGSVKIAKRMHISQLVIGLTVVAFGTSTPELVVSINSALEGQADISLGNIIGSNIVNIGLILGLSAAIFPIAVHIKTIRREIPIMLAVSLIIIPISLDGTISQIDGAFLVISLIAFIYFSYRQSKKENTQIPLIIDDNRENSISNNLAFTPLIKNIVFVIIGIILLYFGSSFTVDNAVSIANSLGISERIIGLTIIAIGTSLPELITSVGAARKKHTDLSIGNIIGSNNFNVLSILGISSLIIGIKVNFTIFIDYIVMIGFSAALIPVMKSGFIITKKEGYILVTAYLLYLGFLIMTIY